MLLTRETDTLPCRSFSRSLTRHEHISYFLAPKPITAFSESSVSFLSVKSRTTSDRLSRLLFPFRGLPNSEIVE